MDEVQMRQKTWTEVLKGKRIERVGLLHYYRNNSGALLLQLSDKSKHLLTFGNEPGQWYLSNILDEDLRLHAWFFGAETYKVRLEDKRREAEQKRLSQAATRLSEYRDLRAKLKEEGLLPEKESP